MDLEKFFHGHVSYIQEDLYDQRYDQCVSDFFNRSVEYKRT